MKKCKCGSTEFTATVIEPIEYKVDGRGRLLECIGTDENYDAFLAVPESYSCADCGEVYDAWDEIPEA